MISAEAAAGPLTITPDIVSPHHMRRNVRFGKEQTSSRARPQVRSTPESGFTECPLHGASFSKNLSTYRRFN